MGGAVAIRPARPDDVELIFSLIVELAAYERARDQVAGTPELLHESLFGASPVAEAVIAEVDGEQPDDAGGGRSGEAGRRAAAVPAGFALFHSTFSTWECRPGIWLEDLYVPPQHRRAGVGEALLRHLAALAVERGCTRLAWTALDWNEPALRFYEKLGAQVLDEWKLLRLSGEALSQVAPVAVR